MTILAVHKPHDGPQLRTGKYSHGTNVRRTNTVTAERSSRNIRSHAANTFAAVTVPDWTTRAVCARPKPTDLFFPPRGANGATIASATAMCATCPVIASCAALALDIAREGVQDKSSPLQGVWAGVYFGNTALNKRAVYQKKLDALYTLTT